MSPFAPAIIRKRDPMFVGTYTQNGIGKQGVGLRAAAPASQASGQANRIYFTPFFIAQPYDLRRWWWQNGATVGTDYITLGIYDADLNLRYASPRVLSAGTANYVQFSDPGIMGTNITSGGDITDADTYTLASITLKAGVCYLLAVENSHATDGAAVSSVDSATAGYPTFTSRSTTTYNSTNNRVSIWSAVPTVDWTGALRIQFGASSGTTGCVWSLNGFYGVDTAATDGVVQQAVDTGTSVTPLATLAAFGNAHNATFGAMAAAANQTAAPTGTTAGYLELSDSGIATPAQALETMYNPANDTTVDATITSAAWGACAVELKALLAPIRLPPMRGYLAWHASGTTATCFGGAATTHMRPYGYLQSSVTTGLPALAVPAAGTGLHFNCGFTSRTTP